MLSISIEGVALSPAPPVTVELKVDSFTLVSVPSREAKDKKDLTEVRRGDAKGEVIWSFNDWVGYRKALLPASGEKVLMFGTSYIGSAT